MTHKLVTDSFYSYMSSQLASKAAHCGTAWSHPARSRIDLTLFPFVGFLRSKSTGTPPVRSWKPASSASQVCSGVNDGFCANTSFWHARWDPDLLIQDVRPRHQQQ